MMEELTVAQVITSPHYLDLKSLLHFSQERGGIVI